MNFKPSKWKIIISILISAVLGLIPLVMYYFDHRIYASGGGDLPSIFEWISRTYQTFYLTSTIKFILIIFVISYIIWSLIEKKKKRNKK